MRKVKPAHVIRLFSSDDYTDDEQTVIEPRHTAEYGSELHHVLHPAAPPRWPDEPRPGVTYAQYRTSHPPLSDRGAYVDACGAIVVVDFLCDVELSRV